MIYHYCQSMYFLQSNLFVILLYNFNQFFKQVVHRGIDLQKHQQKGSPYRKTSSQGQFPISIIKTSTSTNTNIVFPCKLCTKNIIDRDAAIQCDICHFWVHLMCNKRNLVDY